MYLFKWIKNNIKTLLLALLIVPFFLWCFCNASPNDLLWQLVEPAYYQETIIWLWKSKETVWRNVFKWVTEVGVGVYLERRVVTDKETGKPVCRFWPCDELCSSIDENLSNSDRLFCKRQWKFEGVEVWLEAWAGKQPSLIVKVTRMLLILTIALSVTMILYNGMMYIVKTWQWKEWKDVIKNIAYIVIWILIALFSVIIIRIIQSIPSTLADEEELAANGYELDKAAISQNDKWKSWRAKIATF